MDNYTGSTITLDLTPRWWQFIRRFRAWRNERDMIGKTVNVEGQKRTITDYRAGTRVATVKGGWNTAPTSSSTFEIR